MPSATAPIRTGIATPSQFPEPAARSAGEWARRPFPASIVLVVSSLLLLQSVAAHPSDGWRRREGSAGESTATEEPSRWTASSGDGAEPPAASAGQLPIGMPLPPVAESSASVVLPPADAAGRPGAVPAVEDSGSPISGWRSRTRSSELSPAPALRPVRRSSVTAASEPHRRVLDGPRRGPKPVGSTERVDLAPQESAGRLAGRWADRPAVRLTAEHGEFRPAAAVPMRPTAMPFPPRAASPRFAAARDERDAAAESGDAPPPFPLRSVPLSAGQRGELPDASQPSEPGDTAGRQRSSAVSESLREAWQTLTQAAPVGGYPGTTGDGTLDIPFRSSDTVVSRRDLELRMNGGLITLIANDARLSDILAILASDHGLNLVTSEAIDVRVTVSLHDVPLADALNAILSIHGYSWARRNDIITVSRVAADQPGGALVQGRMLRVYSLSFIDAEDIQTAVAELLSPVGSVRALLSDSADSRKTRDQLIVEDLPEYLERIDSCIRQLDRPPLQVLIEAHILEVTLNTNNRHGVDLTALTSAVSPDLTVSSTGFASDEASPALLVGLDTTHLDGLIEALKTTVDARTLASPRVMVTHGQQARIQIGGRIGYRQSTTTETSTVESVEFLEVGVVLNVTPYVGPDGRILMKVNPEISDGRLNLETELPDETITTVDSTVVLRDGMGMVIGGLIREDDDDRRSKTPGLGETWMINRLFQLVRHERQRREVIVALMPRIVIDGCPAHPDEPEQLDRVNQDLFYGPLKRNPRPWEPELPEVRYRPPHVKYNLQEFRFSEGTRLTDDPALRSDPAQFVPQTPGPSWLSSPVLIETAPSAAPRAVPPSVPPAVLSPSAVDPAHAMRGAPMPSPAASQHGIPASCEVSEAVRHSSPSARIPSIRPFPDRDRQSESQSGVHEPQGNRLWRWLRKRR